MERSPFLKKYFVGPIFKDKTKVEENTVSVETVNTNNSSIE
jgi:hypothetical protein